MSWRSYLTMCVVLFYLLDTTACVPARYQAIRQRAFKDQVFTGNYTSREFNNTDGVGCATQCALEIRCAAFSFNKMKQICRVYKIAIFSPSDAVNAWGWRFYLFGSLECPLKYQFVHSREAQLCFKLTDGTMTRENGQNLCHAQGADLIRILDKSGQEHIQTLMKPTQYNSMDIWLKLSTLNTPTWSWDHRLSLGWSNWMPGDPDCGDTKVCDCVVAAGTVDFQWGDRPCGENNYVLCEYRL